MKQFGNVEVEKAFDAKVLATGGRIDPYKKIGLRRSPVGSQEMQPLQEHANPFKKSGLRRSPTSSQPMDSQPEKDHVENEVGATSPIQLGVSQPTTEKSGLRKLPISSQPLENQQEVVIPSNEVGATPPIELGKSQPTTQKPGPRRSPRFEDAAEQNTLLDKQPSQSTKESEQVVPDSFEAAIIKDTRSQDSTISQKSTLPGKPPQKSVKRSSRLSQRLEPELPPTPVQRGIADPIVTTPPSGIHDTPSRKAKKNKALSSKLKSSPLKPRDAPPAEPTLPEPAKELPLVPETRLERPLKRRRSVRLSIPVDPHAAKKRIRDELQKELELLEADIALANKENERLRLQQGSKSAKPTKSSNLDELMALLLRSTAPEPPPKPKVPLSILKSTTSFLPFSAPLNPQVILPLLDKPPPSHAPLDVSDPLPHLQLFSPLTYTSTTTLLPSLPDSSDPDDTLTAPPIFQKYTITASHPSGLFFSRFSMTVLPYTPDTVPSIQEITIDALDSAAEPELGDFVRRQADLKAMPILGWAMGRWLEVARRRAAFWCAVQDEVGSKEKREKTIAKLSAGKKGRGRKNAEMEDDEEGDEERDRGMKGKWSRRQLLQRMGRTSMEIEDEGSKVELRIEWTMEFDWTGEVESKLSAAARVPMGCKSYSSKPLFPLASHPSLLSTLNITN